jgi:hypothetical protein
MKKVCAKFYCAKFNRAGMRYDTAAELYQKAYDDHTELRQGMGGDWTTACHEAYLEVSRKRDKYTESLPKQEATSSELDRPQGSIGEPRSSCCVKRLGKTCLAACADFPSCKSHDVREMGFPSESRGERLEQSLWQALQSRTETPVDLTFVSL